MRIKHQDMKDNLIEVIPESIDDLWHLSHIVEKNDYVSTLTTRRIQDNNSGKTRADSGVKKTFIIGIGVQKISFHKFTGVLRFTGIIKSAPEELIPLGSYHTLNIKVNDSIRIIKNWNKWSLDRLNKAVEQSNKTSQIIVTMEDNTTYLGLIKQYGIDTIGPITGQISGKRILSKNRSSQIKEYFESVTNTLLQQPEINKLIIIGPGFTKESYYHFLEDKYPDLAKKSVIESTGAGGHAGIQEVLKNGLIEQLSQENTIANEISSVNKLLENLAKNTGLVTYGKKQVKNAIKLGAVEKLLILDELVRNKEYQKLMDRTEQMAGVVSIISSQHDGGKQLEALGSIAAFLRYPIE
ncbi:MAG: mRNA surveillance protein pelota [Methanosphaera sp.]|nr:mRNA surveillance protein pelota [Methanosphaera sp.]